MLAHSSRAITMKITYFLALFASAVMSVQSVSLSEYKCGTDQITTLIAYRSAKATCRAHLDSINQCCGAHDQCYNDQAGRKYCDSTFCSCLRKTTETYNEKCQSTLKNMCRMVKLFGAGPYKRSARHRRNADQDDEDAMVDLSHANWVRDDTDGITEEDKEHDLSQKSEPSLTNSDKQL
uniref:Phospholipase A2 n=1 Tax=Steinernema glaseri TaxID=37863 RepID=A0A1I7YEV5_9BILA